MFSYSDNIHVAVGVVEAEVPHSLLAVGSFYMQVGSYVESVIGR